MGPEIRPKTTILAGIDTDWLTPPFAKTKNCTSQVYTVAGTKKALAAEFTGDVCTSRGCLTFATVAWTDAKGGPRVGAYVVNATRLPPAPPPALGSE